MDAPFIGLPFLASTTRPLTMYLVPQPVVKSMINTHIKNKRVVDSFFIIIYASYLTLDIDSMRKNYNHKLGGFP
jgi:hypothetical protein